MIGTNIVIRSFFYKNNNMKVKEMPLSQCLRGGFKKLLGILKVWLLGEVFKPKLSMFSKQFFLLPQSTYFVIAPLLIWPSNVSFESITILRSSFLCSDVISLFSYKQLSQWVLQFSNESYLTEIPCLIASAVVSKITGNTKSLTTGWSF